MSLLPNLGLVFDAPRAQGEFGRGLAQTKLAREQLEANKQFQRAQIDLMRRSMELKEQNARAERIRGVLESERAARLEPLTLQKLQNDLVKQEADIASTVQDMQIKEQDFNLKKSERVANYLANVKDQASLNEANNALIKLGIIDKPIGSVGEAKVLELGSSLAQERIKAKDDQEFELKKLEKTQAFQEKLQSQNLESSFNIAALNRENQLKMQQKGFDQQARRDIALNKQDKEKIILREAAKMVAGTAPQTNINLDESLFKKRASGGPIQPGQPTIVGENGPEVIVPQQDATVLNQNQITQLAQGQAPTYNDDSLITPDSVPPHEQLGAADLYEQEGQRAGSSADAMLEQLKNTRPKDKGKPDSPENAAKKTQLMVAKAAKERHSLREIFFDKNGELNRKNLVTFDLGSPIGRLGTDKAKLAASVMEFGIQAITRNETGAAMAESEIENVRARFMPSLSDTEEIAHLKLDMYDKMIDGTLELIEGKGKEAKFLEEKFELELQNRSDYVKEFMDVNPNATVQDAIAAGKYYGEFK